MSRTLIALLALLGLSLGSCSSSPAATELGINPDINTSHFSPRHRGMSGSGASFDKYWLGYDAHSPYADSTTPKPWYNFLTPWNWSNQGRSFGDVTERNYRPRASSIVRPNAYDDFYNTLFNNDADDPYHD